jgi:flavin reductase (DIM6/NTAB) family NADH-FMN oxidoreductase RutF
VSFADADLLFRRLDREVWLVTSQAGDRRGGLIATAVMSASIVPTAPRVVLAVSRQHATWEVIETSSAFTLQLLPADTLTIVERFGLHSSREVDKFIGFDWQDVAVGGPLWSSAAGWLDCSVEACFDVGDRTLYLAAINAAQAPAEGTNVLTTSRLFQDVPRDWLPRLREQLAADAALDLVEITKWRSRR